ncbi:MAG: hypothetical protein HWD85_05735 [Flavobacteriaceae bacterium]|nr:hypothetical protein [Flavobacteriaceae bacterium]
MITETEQKQLKLLFNGHYTEDVLKILNDKNIRNRNGKPHSAPYIRMVFQGIRNNSDIEAAIWQLAEKKKQALAWKKLQKSKVFNNNTLR